MLHNLTREVPLGTRADGTLPSIGATGLAVAVGMSYFFAARLGLTLLGEPDGVAVFWPAAGGVMVATIVANLMGDRNIWSATAFAFCNAGEALLTAWLIERYFGLRF